tara:strand:- start:994 stop:1401 length:408 start_codon:yes stop_codon:yes gene_type:complete
MKITKQRLKEIIMEEIALQEATPDIVDADIHSGETAYVGNAPANQGGMSEIEEGLEMVTPENIKLVADVVTQMGVNFAPAIIMAALALPGMQAIDYLKQKAAEKGSGESPESSLEEENNDALTNLISQVVQEHLS